MSGMKRRKGRTVAIVAGAGVLALALLLGVYWEEIVAWIRFVRTFEDIGTNEQGYAEYRHRQTEIVFVKLPGGTFWMGTSQEEGEKIIQESPIGGTNKRLLTKWIATEQPYHEVTLSRFLIAKYEMSQAEWKKVMGNNRSEFKGDALPVDNVSWEDCQEFCGLTGLRLPSEAQWEYACRAGTSTRFAFGDKLTRKQANLELARRTVAVHSYEPNGFGLYNVHGNVWEWCEDVHDPEFYRKPQASHRDPLCTSGSSKSFVRVVRRGGSYHNSSSTCRSGQRGHAQLPFRGDVGFRPSYYPLP